MAILAAAICASLTKRRAERSRKFANAAEIARGGLAINAATRENRGSKDLMTIHASAQFFLWQVDECHADNDAVSGNTNCGYVELSTPASPLATYC